MTIQALIFDFDGTLVNSMPLHWRAWQVITARHGFQFSETRFYALGGVPSRDILKTLFAEQGLRLEPLVIAKEKENAYLELLAHIEPIELVMNIAREHFGKLPMAIASGGTRRVIDTITGHLGIRQLFNTVVTSEDVLRQKPAPDIFLEAARRLGVSPCACRAYEDTDLGLQAIRAAGMAAVDVRELLVNGTV